MQPRKGPSRVTRRLHGGVLHSLMMLMPWLEFAQPERTVPTVQDPLTDLGTDEPYFGETIEIDDGALVGTV